MSLNPASGSGPDARAEALASAYERVGYARLAPPILQPAEPFLDLSGEDIRKRMYLTTAPGGEEMCLRPDLTVPDLTVGQSAADLDAAAAAVAAAPAPVLVAVDVDGTLSPLAPRADQAVLAPGAADVLAALVAHGVPVAVVSGRGLDDLLHQFEWPGGLRMLGSHGLEDTAQQAVVPTAEERQRLQAVRTPSMLRGWRDHEGTRGGKPAAEQSP